MTEAKTSSGKQKWLYVILGMIMFICLGTVYSWSVFKSPFENLYGIDATLSGLPYLFFLLFYTIFMLLSGKAVDRYNPRKIIIFGGVLVGLGWMLSGIIHNFYAVIFFYGVISGSGVGIAYGVPIKVVSNWFTEKKGLALGLLLSGFGLSPFVTAPIIEVLIEKAGINQTFMFIGIAFLIIIPVLGLFFKHPENLPHHDYSKPERTIKELIKGRNFIGLWICFAIGTTVGLMVIGVSSQIGQELFGISAGNAAFLISVFAVFNAIGRPAFGYLADKFSPSFAITLSFTLIIASSVAMLINALYSVALYVICLSILWMNLGAWLSIAPTATGLMFDPKSYSRNYGVLFTAYGAGALLGTPIAGFLRTSLGSYKYIFIPAAILAAIGIFVSFILIHKKNTEIS